MSNSSNTANRWSVTYATTVYAILSVQALTNHRFNVTEEYISWAMDIDATNQATEHVAQLEVCIPRYNLRSRQIFNPLPDDANKVSGPQAGGSSTAPVFDPTTAPLPGTHAPVEDGRISARSLTIDDSSHTYPTPPDSTLQAMDNTPAPGGFGHGVPAPVSYPFPTPIPISGASRFRFTIAAGGPHPDIHSSLPGLASFDSHQVGVAEVPDASNYWNGDWGDDQIYGEAAEEDNDDDDEGEESEEENARAYWSLKRQHEVLGEAHEDYLEH